MVGLAPETSSTVTILRPGRETKLKVSAGRDRRASRSLSWYNGFDHSCQKPVTACGLAVAGQESNMAISSFKVGVSTPDRSERSKDLIMPAQSRSAFWDVSSVLWGKEHRARSTYEACEGCHQRIHITKGASFHRSTRQGRNGFHRLSSSRRALGCDAEPRH